MLTGTFAVEAASAAYALAVLANRPAASRLYNCFVFENFMFFSSEV
jgi:hypothetical protein